MPALSYFGQDRATTFAPRICEPRRFGFCQADLGIAAKRSKAAADTGIIGKARVEKRHAVHTPAARAQMTRTEIDPAQVEGLQRRFRASLARLAFQPMGRSDISVRRRPMVPLAVVGDDGCCDTTLQGRPQHRAFVEEW